MNRRELVDKARRLAQADADDIRRMVERQDADFAAQRKWWEEMQVEAAAILDEIKRRKAPTT